MRALALLTLLIALYGPPVAAQMGCGLYITQIMQLEMKYGESLQSRGTTTGTLMELWANETEGNWTLLERFANGTSCLRAVGENYQAFEPEIPGDDT